MPTPELPQFDAQALGDQGRTKRGLLLWDAPTHADHERSHRWYITIIVVAAVIALWCIVVGAWTVSLVTVVAAGTYLYAQRHEMPVRTMIIEEDGFRFADRFIPWSDCTDFWIIETPQFSRLHIARKGKGNRVVSIQTGDIDPTVIRTTISRFLPLRPDQRERLLDLIIRLCKL